MMPDEKGRPVAWLSRVLFTFSFIGFAVAPVVVVLLFFAPTGVAWLLEENTGAFHKYTNVADLDGDGDLDVVLYNVRQESEITAFSVMTLWFNQGDGWFEGRRIDDGTFEGGGWDSAAGDVDGDGDIDLAIFMGYRLRLMLNQGVVDEEQAVVFRNGASIPGPERNGQYGQVLLEDLNQDGLMDGLVIGCCGRLFTVDDNDHSPNVSGVWLNKWDQEGRAGEMTTLPALAGLAVRDAALGDLDGDGDRDVFAAVIAPHEGLNRNPADRVLFNDGSGHFTDSGQLLGGADSTAVALGDMDNDGDLDALVGNDLAAVLWLNQGGAQGAQEGMFFPGGELVFGEQVEAVFLADLDEDGDMDALIGGQERAQIWWNDGQGMFSQDRQRFTYSKRHGLAVGDFNGDGRLDILAAAYDTNVRLWLNKGEGNFRTAR